MPIIRTLVLRFSNEISASDIPKFRGAVIASLKEKNILYHNHDENGVVYRYPRIQYKRINKKAAIVCVKEGVDAIHELFTSGNFTYYIGEKDMEMRIEFLNTYENDIVFCDTPYYYRIRNWLPFNSANYAKYQGTEGLVEKLQILERVLIGNILSFLKGVDIHIEEPLELHITNITNQRPITYKKVIMMAFDIEFKTNLFLPQYIGIGKNASVGCGVLTIIK